MKFKLLFILIITPILFLLAACTGSSSGQETTEMGVVYRSPT